MREGLRVLFTGLRRFRRDFAYTGYDWGSLQRSTATRLIAAAGGADRVPEYLELLDSRLASFTEDELARRPADSEPEPKEVATRSIRFLFGVASELRKGLSSRAAPFVSPVDQLSTAMEIDIDAAGNLWGECRAVEPAITVEEIVTLCVEKLRNTKVVSSLTGLLLKSVPKMCAGGTLKAARQQLYELSMRRDLHPVLNEYLGRIRETAKGAGGA
jgi:hypothetical protein